MKLIKLEKKYQGKFISYYVATFLNNLGKEKLYEFTSRDSSLTMEKFHGHSPAGVGMVCFNKDKSKVLLQKEYRLACNEWVYNFSAGLIDEGEKIEETARRELKEETGIDLIQIDDILPPTYCSPGTSDEMMSIVICRGEGEIKDSCYIDEEIHAKWYSKEEVRELFKEKAYMSVRTQAYLYMWINEN